jgi:hypothetical protein
MAGILPLGPCALATMVWRYRGELQLTVVVKADFAFVHDGAAARLDDVDTIAREDRRHRDHPLASVVAPSDMVPSRPHADVLLVGSAKSAQPVTELAVRLGVFREARPVLDKLLSVEDAAPFTEMPLLYERAYGASVDPANPAGMEEAHPDVVYPDRRRVMAGFGPIGMLWRDRRRLRGSLRGLFGAETVVVPPNMDWQYFQSAPPDQRCPHLAGDEWILAQGVHREHALWRTQLPRAAAAGVVFGVTGHDDPTGSPIGFACDQLLVDVDRGRLTLVWRGAVPVPSEDAAAHALVVAGVETGANKLALPAARPEKPALQAPAARAGAMRTMGMPIASPSATAAPFAVASPGSQRMVAATAPSAPPPKWTGPVQATLDVAPRARARAELEPPASAPWRRARVEARGLAAHRRRWPRCRSASPRRRRRPRAAQRPSCRRYKTRPRKRPPKRASRARFPSARPGPRSAPKRSRA